MSRTLIMWMQVLFIGGPILCLLAVGLFLTLRSGLIGFSSEIRERSARSWIILVNASRTLLALAGSIVLLAVLQELIGVPRDVWR